MSFASLFGGVPVPLDELVARIRAQSASGPRTESSQNATGARPGSGLPPASLDEVLASLIGPGLKEEGQSGPPIFESPKDRPGYPSSRPLPSGLAAMIESILGPGIRNGATKAEKPPRRVGKTEIRKFGRFVMVDGTYTEPRRVRKRALEELGNVPEHAVGFCFHNEWVLRLRDNGKDVILKSADPVRVGAIQYFKAAIGTVQDLLGRKVLTTEEVRTLRRTGVVPAKLIVARTHGCADCKSIFDGTDPKAYKILVQL